MAQLIMDQRDVLVCLKCYVMFLIYMRVKTRQAMSGKEGDWEWAHK